MHGHGIRFQIADEVSFAEATRRCEAASAVLVDDDEQFRPKSRIPKFQS
jgi:hypothetical protein